MTLGKKLSRDEGAQMRHLGHKIEGRPRERGAPYILLCVPCLSQTASQTGSLPQKGGLKNDGGAALIINSVPTGHRALCVLRALSFTDTQVSSREKMALRGCVHSLPRSRA